MRIGFLLLLAWAAPLFSQETKYLSSDEIRSQFELLAVEHPKKVQIKALPGNVPGLYAVWLGEAGADKATVLLLGSLRADELSPGLACLEFARSMLKAATEPNERHPYGRVVIIPAPCGASMNGPFAKPATSQPGLNHPLDDDRDNATDEDGPSDINADGMISQMRIPREGGKYRVSQYDPRVLTECKPGELNGQFDLMWEGVDDDGDGRINEDAKGIVTLANDFAIRWSDKQPGANRFPMLTAESRAIADFMLANPQICTAIQLRSLGGKLVCAGGPPAGPQPQGRGRRGAAVEDALTRDKQLYETWQKRMDGLGPGKAAGAAEPPEPDGAGNILDWLYEACGVYAANWHMFRLPQEKEEKKERKEGEPAPDKPSREEQDEINWLKYTPEGWREWKAFKHPQLGEVEIGGWAITSRKDCKPADVAALIPQLTVEVNLLLAQMPRLNVDTVEKKSLGDGLYRIRLTLTNPKDIDYRPVFAANNRIGMPVFVGLEEDKEVELISGTRRNKLENVLSGTPVTFEWVVGVKDAAKELKFKVEAQRTGDVSVNRALKDCVDWKE